ncbi:hypothetical protein [Leptothoe spongobia]|uniref:Uncharacterized protein n=1 Tax=Leptothoe spongobia TAU-MAC 1115 TaxID=1967444 RepID=A0A947GLX6_9CYAN|nr:hypothetical protein [Leptothoe spongobia]MBT9317307.1 hypothetical protein [Leptothoe spongobia TAU-MAC 1115]
MAQITIEVPDEFAQRLAPFQSELSDIFTRFISATLLSETSDSESLPSIDMATPPATYQEVVDFLISRPTSQQIIGFKVSDQSQTRLQNLLQKNREASLSPAEKGELDLYEQLDHLVSLLKVRAFSNLKPSPEV